MLSYELSHTGLGTTIGFLSLLREAQQPITIQATSSYNLLHDIKRVFNLDWLTIVTNDSLTEDLVGSPNGIGDSGKFYSHYLLVDTINVSGQQYSVGKKNKPCIGLATWNLQYEFGDDNFPYNRLYTRDIWSKIFQLCLHAGYDVITLNSKDIDFEKKTFMMNELCDCIIGYEGGIAHLAHVLKIPTIILPWRTWCNESDRLRPPGDLKMSAHRFHVDKKTYFLDSVDELIQWSPHELKHKIDQLYNDQGNNICLANFKNDPPYLTTFEKDFIQTYIKNPTVGGY
jgi:hypothetical protein